MKNLFCVLEFSFLKKFISNNNFRNRYKRKTLILTSLSLFISFFLSCNTTEPPSNQTLTLKLEDVSCTEAWIQLTTTNLQLPATINLLKNNSVSQVYVLNTQDSLLYIDSLLPNKNYSFQVSSIQSTAGGPVSPEGTNSNELNVTTMDTTSHNFTWQSWEFGVITNQSHLFDVAIIDENNIWAVGEIYMRDSLGRPDPNAYNAVHWDGTKWELKKIGGQGGWACHTVFAFSANDIWFEGNIHWNGSTYTAHMNGWPLMPNGDGWQVNKMWGSSSEDLYAVGNNGNIAHWDGKKWTKIESGTGLSLSDITNNYSNEIFVCGGNVSFAKGIILKSKDGKNFAKFVEGDFIPESQLFNPNLYGSFSSIWIDNNNTLYSGGNILFEFKLNKWSYVKSLPENFIGGNPGVYYRGYITKVRGNVSNDMWIVGDRNTVRHFNGISWEQIGLPYDPNIDLVWRSIACTENVSVMVGTHNRSAIIMILKR